MSGIYKNKPLNGISRFYSLEGICLSETVFAFGKRVGTAKKWNCKGNLISIERYQEGHLHGKQEYYYPNGVLKTELNYQKGQLHGPVYLFQVDGRLKRCCSFKEGQIDVNQPP